MMQAEAATVPLDAPVQSPGSVRLPVLYLVSSPRAMSPEPV